MWLVPDGEIVPDEAEVSLRAHTTGPAPVTLIGISGSLERLEVAHDLRAVD